jgi:PhnB protein
MFMAVRSIPDGYHSVTPYLIAQGVPALIEFLKRAFDAKELERHTSPDGSIRHAEVRIGDSPVMMGEANAMHPAMPCTMYVYVNDCDATYHRALEAGATSVMAPADQFYGDRSGGVKDGSGNYWWIATHKEDVPPEELKRRAASAFQKK